MPKFQQQERYIYLFIMSDNFINNPFIDQLDKENVDILNNNTMPFETEEDLKAKEEKERKRQNSLNNLKTFKPYSELSPEELERQKNVVEKAKKGRTLQAQKERSMKESAKQLLKARVSRDKIEKYLGADADLDGIETMQDLIMARMFREILENGNTKAAEFIRDTSGNKPISSAELDIRADIITAADRALIEKVSDRLGLVDITDDDDK